MNKSTRIALILLIIAAVGGYWLVRTRTGGGPDDGGQIACTQDAKVCPDGSFVSRTGPNCEFAPCPNGEAKSEEAVIDTSNWKTYRSEQHGLAFKYPADCSIYVQNLEDVQSQGSITIICSAPETDFSGIKLRLPGGIRVPLIEWLSLRKKDFGYEMNDLISALRSIKTQVGIGYHFRDADDRGEIIVVELNPRGAFEERTLLIIESYIDDGIFENFLKFLDRI